MKHFGHQHSLILNENYIAGEADKCNGCLEDIISCKSFIYTCSNRSTAIKTRGSGFYFYQQNSTGADKDCIRFLLHKTCAELPQRIENPTNPNQVLVLFSQQAIKEACTHCDCNICYDKMPWNYCSSEFKFRICLRCAILRVHSLEDRKFEHAAHSQHPVALIQRPSSFKCDACKVKKDFQDMSYKCSKCQFWIHKTCGDAPKSFQFHFHRNHPLVLAYSLPKVYHKFIQYCKLCDQTMSRSNWLYYCPKCRFFVHFQCTRSSHSRLSKRTVELSSWDHNQYPNLVHLPAADESSVSLLLQQFARDMSTKYDTDNIIRSSIEHWYHPQHHLKLITTNELNDQKDGADDDILLFCDGCAKPIQTDRGQSYACVPCNILLHKFCALLPKEFKENLGETRMLYAERCTEPYNLFFCSACGDAGNCIFFTDHKHTKLHIRCAALPKRIKHEAHIHPLEQICEKIYNWQCKACGDDNFRYLHRCRECHFYICDGCIMNASTVNHRWDPHPLHLIYEVGMVTEDHEHEFSCEFCSNEIDTNWWFYHCSICDLSFHPKCLKRLCNRHYSDVKFGAKDILSYKLHPHSLTFDFNKRFQKCERCGKEQLAEPVLRCAPCKTIFCISCRLSLM